MLWRRSCGFLVANSRTSFVFSGGTCLRIICPGGTVQSSSGNNAPDPTYRSLVEENIKREVHTSTQMLSGNRRGRFSNLWKYWATVMVVPSRMVKLRSDAPALLSFLTTRGVLRTRSPEYVVMIRIPVTNRWRRIRSRSGMLRRGLKMLCWPGLPRKSKQRSSNGPGLYMVPVEISTLTSNRPMAGLTDWKYPRQRTRPPPMSLVSRSVKKDRTLNGYFITGSMRTTTLSA